jgi:signal transduction histidine kinase
MQTAHAKEINLTTPNAQWMVYQTHDSNTDLSHLKASDWQPASVPAILIKNPKNGVYLWYKREFDIVENSIKTFKDEPLSLFIKSIRNSDETWLNGTKIGQIGEISPPWDVWQKYPLNLPRVYGIPAGLLTPSNNTLLIKINTGIGDIAGTEYFGSVGITGKVSVQTESYAKEAQYKINLKGNNIDVMIIVLGFIDIFLIFFLFKNTLHNIPEFPWLLLNSILMIAATLMLDVYYLNGLKFPVFGFIRYITVFSIPFVTALYFWSQNKNLSKKLVVAFGVVQLIAAAIVLIPWFPSFLKAIAWKATLVLAVLFLLYALYCSIRNLRHNQVGSLAQFIGLVFYLFSIRSDVFGVDLFQHRGVYVGALVFRYALLLAYFQRIRHMSACYKTLSSRMLSTIESKREEMARELHDGLGQHLASSKFQAQLATVSDDKKHLGILTKELDSAVSSMHRILAGLHPMALDRYKLQKAIKLESKRFESVYPMKFKLDIDEQVLPKELEVHLYRIFQETVSNALRHGKASRVEVRLKSLTNKLSFSIKDNGIGYTDASKKVKGKESEEEREGGFGFISLQERVNLIGARLERFSRPDKGTEIFIEIPLG